MVEQDYRFFCFLLIKLNKHVRGYRFMLGTLVENMY